MEILHFVICDYIFSFVILNKYSLFHAVQREQIKSAPSYVLAHIEGWVFPILDVSTLFVLISPSFLIASPSGVPFLVRVLSRLISFLSFGRGVRGVRSLKRRQIRDGWSRGPKTQGKTDVIRKRNSKCARVGAASLARATLPLPSLRFPFPFLAACTRRLMWETCNVFTDENDNKNMTSSCDGIRLQ